MVLLSSVEAGPLAGLPATATHLVVSVGGNVRGSTGRDGSPMAAEKPPGWRPAASALPLNNIEKCA
ncbi:MAG: hypothetical protein GTO03_15730 [Planctomycetales bacterium]|nr:hypothetical protein [Planctomycetales bacterium]